MAIILRGQTKCALCGEIIQAADDLVAAPHFIADTTDSLWKYSDAGFHRSCFIGWDQRAVFVARFNATYGKIVFGNGSTQKMQDNGDIHSGSL